MSVLEGEEGVRADDDYAKGETCMHSYRCCWVLDGLLCVL